MLRLILILLTWFFIAQADKPVLPVAPISPTRHQEIGKSQMRVESNLPADSSASKREVVAEAGRYKNFVGCKDQGVGRSLPVKPDWPLKKQSKDGFYRLD